MRLGFLAAAITAYLTGAVAIYAYLNRNRYLDLLIAIVALFSFGTAMLLQAFGAAPFLADTLFQAAVGLVGAAAILVVGRVVLVLYRFVRRRMRR